MIFSIAAFKGEDYNTSIERFFIKNNDFKIKILKLSVSTLRVIVNIRVGK